MKKIIINNLSPEKISVSVAQNENDVNVEVVERDETSVSKIDNDTYQVRVLKDVLPGEIIKIGKHNYIVLNQGKETTALISEEFVHHMAFGENANYSESLVNNFLNNDFYEELAFIVGKENIIRHTVNLEADNGTGKGENFKTNISLLTTNLYRKYKQYIPAEQYDYWWTATRIDAEDEYYVNDINIISDDGIVFFGNCTFEGGVRPYFILNSSIRVNDGNVTK